MKKIISVACWVVCYFYFIFAGLIFAVNSEASPELAGCSVLPDNNIWNTPVDTLPKDANSDAYIASIGAATGLFPDFGSGTWEGAPIGIPYVAVAGTQPKVSVSFDYADESDPGPYPIPPDAPIEGGPNGDGDRHVLIIDSDNCTLYELFDAFPQSDGTWTAGSGAIYDLNSNALRPDTWTSADAAGLPIVPGLARYDEVAAGEIKHALRFTVEQTRRAYVWPARHFASSLTDSKYPPMGQRFRLKADYDISGFSSQAQIILAALKKYGMILADNGSDWFISGAPDDRWNNDVLREIKQVRGADMEAVDVSSLIVSADSGQAGGVIDDDDDDGNITNPGTVPVYRFYSEILKKHFFTRDANEKDTIIATFPVDVWRYEGIAWYVYPDAQEGLLPVYRFYSELLKSHFFTTDANEKDTLIATFTDDVWRYEGIAWYVHTNFQEGTLPVYRFYSDTLKSHFYTRDENEKNVIIATFPVDIWRYEGIAYYAYP
ncbi:hypothetical protein QUF90_22185 [Desulfococcaceae bacterium HSG9]|nr:hypothetical protein [Desulfococcaceae bacterium HSG9]